MSSIIFKWRSNDNIPVDLYQITKSKIGVSRIDGFGLYDITFKSNIPIPILKIFRSDNKELKVSREISKQLRNYKIHKITHRIKGVVYKNDDLDKLSILLQHYYKEGGYIEIMEQINN